MSWNRIENGASIGERGSEDGIVVRDEEHPDGARITLERDSETAPFTITCGIYGWMMHTRFFRDESEAQNEFEKMKVELARILTTMPLNSDPEADSKSEIVGESIVDFVIKFP